MCTNCGEEGSKTLKRAGVTFGWCLLEIKLQVLALF